MNFAENLKHLRKARNLKQEEIAELTGVNRSTVTKWELGYSSPNAELLYKLSRVLDVTIDHLVGVDNEKTRCGGLVKNLRERKNLTILDVARMTNIDPQELEAIEDGKEIDRSIAEELIDKLNTDMQYVYNASDIGKSEFQLLDTVHKIAKQNVYETEVYEAYENEAMTDEEYNLLRSMAINRMVEDKSLKELIEMNEILDFHRSFQQFRNYYYKVIDGYLNNR